MAKYPINYKVIELGDNKVLVCGTLQKVYAKEKTTILVFDPGEKDDDLGIYVGGMTVVGINGQFANVADTVRDAVSEKKQKEDGTWVPIENKYKLGKTCAVVCTRREDPETGAVSYIAKSVIRYGNLNVKQDKDRHELAAVAVLTVYPSTGDGHEGELTARPNVYVYKEKKAYTPYVNFKMEGADDILTVDNAPDDMIPTEGTKSVTMVVGVPVENWEVDDEMKSGTITLNEDMYLAIKKPAPVED